jgi:hypothetical protein
VDRNNELIAKMQDLNRYIATSRCVVVVSRVPVATVPTSIGKTSYPSAPGADACRFPHNAPGYSRSP